MYDCFVLPNGKFQIVTIENKLQPCRTRNSETRHVVSLLKQGTSQAFVSNSINKLIIS